MQDTYQARWVTKEQVAAIRGTGLLMYALLLDTFKGCILVEPAGSQCEGTILSREVADYELQPVWFSGPKQKLREARQRLGLEENVAVAAM
jgi:hypothetical protein